MRPLGADTDAGIILVRWYQVLPRSCEPVIPDTASLLEAIQCAIEFENLADVFTIVNAAHVQILLKCAMEVWAL